MRFELVQPEQIQVRESQGFVKGDYEPLARVKEPLSDYQTMLDLIRRDPIISTAFDIIVDFATHRGYDFVGSTREKRDELRVVFDDVLNFKQVLPNLLYQMLYYGDGFLELRKNESNEINELWPLETTEMRIAYDAHGKVTGYVQRPFSLSGLTEDQILAKEKIQGIFFSPKEVIHFRMKWVGSQVYSYNPIESASTMVSSSMYASNYLMNMFMNMPPRYVAHLAGVGKNDYELAKKEFRSAKTNYKKTIAFSRSNDPQSRLEVIKIEPPYNKELIEVMNWITNQILSVTRVPRSWIMESGVENRGVTEAEQRPFDVRIKAIHHNILEPPINLKLLPALGYYKKRTGDTDYINLRFNEISIKGEKEILANLAQLNASGLKPNAMKRYLDERGILGIDEDDFQDPMEIAVFGPQPKDNFPSRKREDKTTQDMTNNLDSTGVSSQSAKKMGI